MRKGEELKTPRYASAAVLRDGRLPNSRQIRNRVNSIKRTKKIESKDLENLRNYKVPIRAPPIYYIWRL